jgi:large subunit ribosomal protein L24
MLIKKGDTVKVIAGDYKDKTGKVLKVLAKKDRVVVEGVNIISRHTRPSNAYPDGGIIKREAPIHVSNVKFVENKPVEAPKSAPKAVEEKKVRRAKKSSTELDN